MCPWVEIRGEGWRWHLRLVQGNAQQVNIATWASFKRISMDTRPKSGCKSTSLA